MRPVKTTIVWRPALTGPGKSRRKFVKSLKGFRITLTKTTQIFVEGGLGGVEKACEATPQAFSRKW